MNKAVIKKGKHRPRLPHIGLVFKGEVCYEYKFLPSCMYVRGDNDQYDINKLHGIGYFPHHHRNSARSGWRWSEERGCVEFFAYCYVNRKRVAQFICDVNIGDYIRVSIKSSIGTYLFIVTNYTSGRRDEILINSFKENTNFGYRLGIYVGGGDVIGKDDVALHDMEIMYSKVL